MNVLSILTPLGFIILSLVCIALVLLGMRRVLPKTNFELARQQKIWWGTLIGIMVWLTFISVFSLIGFFSDFSTIPPRMFIVLGIPLIIIIYLTFTPAMREILVVVPPQWLLNVQAFRVVVEILIWMLFIQNLAPVQMTFEGRNWDILSGLLGPVFGIFCFTQGKWKRSWAIFYNLLCLALLANILGLDILSFPTPFRLFMNEPANTIVSRFPYVWLPGILVTMAYSMHIFSLRQLAIKGKINPE